MELPTNTLLCICDEKLGCWGQVAVRFCGEYPGHYQLKQISEREVQRTEVVLLR